jgi:hypothetical protein
MQKELCPAQQKGNLTRLTSANIFASGIGIINNTICNDNPTAFESRSIRKAFRDVCINRVSLCLEQ